MRLVIDGASPGSKAGHTPNAGLKFGDRIIITTFIMTNDQVGFT